MPTDMVLRTQSNTLLYNKSAPRAQRPLGSVWVMSTGKPASSWALHQEGKAG